MIFFSRILQMNEGRVPCHRQHLCLISSLFLCQPQRRHWRWGPFRRLHREHGASCSAAWRELTQAEVLVRTRGSPLRLCITPGRAVSCTPTGAGRGEDKKSERVSRRKTEARAHEIPERPDVFLTKGLGSRGAAPAWHVHIRPEPVPLCGGGFPWGTPVNR